MPALATTPLLDPTKRVNYTLGLVLGEDEFRQEQRYFIERGRLHNRALHGYGTVSGLAVRVVATDDGDAEVQVGPGLAVDPFGESIAVETTQCARLTPWLNRSANRDRLSEAAASPPEEVRLYVTLGYRERLTDDVPVPGAPCRSEDDSAVASRVDDDFELAFSFDRPPHAEDAGVRLFADFLGRIQLVAPESANAGDALDEEAFLAAVRAYAEADGPTSPPESPPSSPPSSPPEAEAPVLILTSEADDLLRAGLRVWVTDLRPLLLGDAYANPREAGDDRVLLAELLVGVERDGDTVRLALLDDAPDVTVVEDDRPYLISTRLLQERLLARFDVRFEETLGIGDAAGGDLAGTYPSPTVRRLQGRDVVDADPANGNVLTWNNSDSRWEPRAPAAAGGGGIGIVDVAEQLPTIPLVTVVRSTDRDRGPGFFLWFHLDANPDLQLDNVPLVERVEDEGVVVWAETESGSPAATPFLRRLGTGSASSDGLPRNTFFLPLRDGERDAAQLRLKFNLEAIQASTPSGSFPLLQWVAQRPVKWDGHDGKSTVTVFHKVERSSGEDPGPPPRTGPQIVAAGQFRITDGRALQLQPVGPVAGNLRMASLGIRNRSDFVLTFDGYDEGRPYVVTATAVVSGDDAGASNTVQVVAPPTSRGIVVRALGRQGVPELSGFMVQVIEITG